MTTTGMNICTLWKVRGAHQYVAETVARRHHLAEETTMQPMTTEMRTPVRIPGSAAGRTIMRTQRERDMLAARADHTSFRRRPARRDRRRAGREDGVADDQQHACRIAETEDHQEAGKKAIFGKGDSTRTKGSSTSGPAFRLRGGDADRHAEADGDRQAEKQAPQGVAEVGQETHLRERLQCRGDHGTAQAA